MDLSNHRQNLRAIFNSALQAVNRHTCVGEYLLAHPVARQSGYLVAIGKAAAAMTFGVCEMMPAQITRALVITSPGMACQPVLRVLKLSLAFPSQFFPYGVIAEDTKA